MKKKEIVIKDTNNLSYNAYLYNKRLELGLKRRKFAKLLNISNFRYKLIERGYVKPNDSDILKINQALDCDIGEYLEGISSYPTEIPERERSKFVKFIYKLIGARWIRITLFTISILFITGFFVIVFLNSYCNKHKEINYSDEVVSVRNGIIEKGDKDISLLGDMYYPEISVKVIDEDNNSEEFYMIYSSYNEKDFLVDEKYIYWNDSYRLLINVYGIEDGYVNGVISITDYESGQSYEGLFTYDNGYKITDYASLLPNELLEKVTNHLNDTDLDKVFSNLLYDKLGLDYDYYEEILVPYSQGSLRTGSTILIIVFLKFVFLIFGALSLFGYIYFMLYGTKHIDERKAFEHNDKFFEFNPLVIDLKKDLRFGPFVPETILEIVGIVLVAIGSLRPIVYASSLINYSSNTLATTDNLLSVQLLGIFLLCFLDLDLFMDDKRALRNVALYSIMFFVLYYIEVQIMVLLEDAGTLFSIIPSMFLMPNPFAMYSMYFLIMLFLYFTPKIIKTKKGLLIYRLLSILPTIYILVSFFLSNGNYFFGMDMSNLWFKYFFSGNRFAFSIIAIIFLYGYYFIRLHYKKKYGEENASKYFMGNRFLWNKNLFIALIFLVVWIFEMTLSGNKAMNDMGLGLNKGLIFLVPLLLCYHPHKGERNLGVDYTTLGLYFFAFSYGYIIAIFIGIIGILL